MRNPDLYNECALCHTSVGMTTVQARTLSGFPLCRACLELLEGYTYRVIVDPATDTRKEHLHEPGQSVQARLI